MALDATAFERIVDFLRRYALAGACVLAPLAFAFFGFNLAMSYVMHSSARSLDWKPAILAPADNPARTQSASTDKIDGKEAAAKPPQEDARLMPLARQIIGRHTYATMTAFLFAAAAFCFCASFSVIVSRRGMLTGVYCSVVAVLAGLGLAELSSGNDDLRMKLVDAVLSEADKAGAYCAMSEEKCNAQTVKGVGMFGESARLVTSLIHRNTQLGFISVFLLLFALAAVSLREKLLVAKDANGAVIDVDSPSLMPVELRKRALHLRILLLGGSLIFVMSVLTSKAAIDWPVSLLADPSRNSVAQIGRSLLELWSAAFTLAILAAFGPAFIAWYADRETYRSLPEEARLKIEKSGGGKIDDGLDILPASAVTSIFAIAAPLLASPLADIAKKVLELGAK